MLISRLNAIPFSRKLPTIPIPPEIVPDPIAAYNPTGHTNEDMAEYPVLTDLTGNGHDITLNNFAWSGMSGIGGYSISFNKGDVFDRFGKTIEAEFHSDKIVVTSILSKRSPIIFTYVTNSVGEATENSSDIESFSVKITGITDGVNLRWSYIDENNSIAYYNLHEGVNILPKSHKITGTTSINLIVGFVFFNNGPIDDLNITIELVPLYGNALVSDGVDDYGICENFPILTKEKGYTVVAVRKILSEKNNSIFLSKAKKWSSPSTLGAFNIEFITSSGLKTTRSFGSNVIVDYDSNLFLYQTKDNYNGLKITVGSNTDNFILRLFGDNSMTFYGNYALYALEIYDRDLTPYQIEAVKKRLMDKYNKPEDTTSDWYGVEWYTNQSASRVMRIGNMNLHRTLPIQSGMYRCVLNDNGEEVYKLDPNDSTKKEDGTPAVLDGTDGQVMVCIPVFYARFESKGYRRRVKLSDHYKPGFIKMGGCYISAYEATVDRTISTLIKLASVVNTTANFRGGNNNDEWDNTYRSFLGMPATATSLTNFRTYARNRKADNTEWNCMDYHAYKALYWLYVVEYANRNCQLGFNDALTSEGFRQGGLGAGVANINWTKWNTFNGRYPFIKCGYTNSLGNKTGVVPFTMPDEYDAETPFTTYVPSYRGVENPFGHIWKWTDGLHIKIQSEEAGGRSILYTADDPASYQDSNYDGYDEIGGIARTGGCVKDILFDEGEMLPTVTTGSSTTKDFSDYFYTNIPASGESLRGVQFGDHAADSSSAGFSSSSAHNVPADASSNVGSRLCYIPNNNNN